MIEPLRQRYRQLADLAADARAATELSRLQLGFQPWTAAALRPAAMLQILNDIIINQRRSVVELGAGLSTLHIARVLAEHGGHLISIEDDADWLALVTAMLEKAGLSAQVTLVHAPLVRCRQALDGLDWYDVAAVEAGLAGAAIDLLLIDGPKAFDTPRRHARYPAYPVLGPALAPRSALALDDAGREGERHVMASWRRLPGFDFEVHGIASGMQMATRGPAFTSQV